MLSPEQIDVLLRPIKASRVATANNQKYLESYDVIAHLIRIFGFGGWSSETVKGPDLIFEQERGNGKWDVSYKATVRLVIHDADGNIICSHDGSATGDGQNQSRTDAHDLALKSAESTAEKRAARKLGDQFGLSLYDKGSLAPTVKHLVSGQRAGSSPPDEGSEDAVGTSSGAGPVAAPPAAPSEPFTPGTQPMSEPQRRKIFALVRDKGVGDAKVYCSQVLGEPVEHLTLLPSDKASRIIDALERLPKEAS